MAGKRNILRLIASKPLQSVEGTISGILILLALYIFSPVYESSPTVLGQLFDLPGFRVTIGAIYLTAGIIGYVGSWSGKIRTRSIGMYAVFLAYLFNTILRIVADGFVPVVWLYTFGMAFVAACLYLNLKWGENNDE